MKHSQRFIFVEWQNTEAMATTTYYSLTFLSIPISNAMQMEDKGKKRGVNGIIQQSAQSLSQNKQT